MHFLVRTDNHIVNSAALTQHVETKVDEALSGLFGPQLRRVEVYFQETNGHSKGPSFRCAVEAHLSGYQPVTVHATSTSLHGALGEAVERIRRALEHRMDRLEERNGRSSLSGRTA